MFDYLKKLGQITTISLSIIAAGVVVISTAEYRERTSKADDGFTINLNSNNMPSNVSGAQEFVSSGISREGIEYPITFNYVRYQYISGKHARLLPNGSMFNYSNNDVYNSRISSIEKINVDYTAVSGSASLYLRAGTRLDGIEWSDNRIALTSGQDLILNNYFASPYYFKLEAPDSSAIDIENVSITYSCGDRSEVMPLANLGMKYSAKNEATNTSWVLTRSSSESNSAVISTKDKNETSYNVTLSVNNGVMTITFSDNSTITANVSDDGITLSSTAVSGTIATKVGQLDWNKVYIVENFENYASDGISWSTINYNGVMTTNWANTKGLRGNYWLGSSTDGNSTINGNFSRVGVQSDNNCFNRKNDYVHSGSQSANIKASNARSYLYSSIANKFAPVNQIIGRGEVFSFWARQKTTTLGTDSEDLKLKAYVYYTPDFDDAVSTSAYAVNNITVGGADTTWSQYFVELDPTKNVYGYSILVEKTSRCASSFLYIDDVEIYTENPDCEFDVFNSKNNVNPFINGLYNGTYRTKKGTTRNTDVNMKIGFSASSYCFLSVDGKVINNATYTINGNSFTVDANNYNNGQIKVITGTFTSTSINVSSVTGSWSSTSTSNTLSKVSASTIDFSESTYDIQKDWYWSFSTSSISTSVSSTAYSGSNQLVATHGDYLSGNCGLRAKVKGSKYTTFVSLKQNVSAFKLNTLGFWVKNTTGKTIRFRLLVITGQTVSGDSISYTFNSSQTISVYFEVPSANHWQCCASTNMAVSNVVNYGLSMYNNTDSDDAYVTISNFFMGK